ncbi:hypothetical protein LCGC14_1436310 [marine sediment metagenome]|uniref:Uncharacterized protein n=1 Tax=marine sediment metagenome TaxID=412755 RepID=A0A0F9K892_9ZZZZ
MHCQKSIDATHRNRKFCSSRCVNKARYKRSGSRSTPEQRAKWYQERCEKVGYRDKLRKQANKRKRKILDFLAEYKLSRGCVDCGYKKYSVALDFDHIKGKKRINLPFAKSINQAKQEIKKCEVVCANCHRVRTYKRCKPDIFKATYEKVEE